MTPTCACIQGRGELAARLCPGPTEGACRVGYGAGDGTDEPCDCRCHDVPPPSRSLDVPCGKSGCAGHARLDDPTTFTGDCAARREFTGMPFVGDPENGGTESWHLCLDCQRLVTRRRLGVTADHERRLRAGESAETLAEEIVGHRSAAPMPRDEQIAYVVSALRPYTYRI